MKAGQRDDAAAGSAGAAGRGGGDDGLRGAVRRRGALLQTVRAVAWSFLGIRRSSGLHDDVSRLNPVHVLIVGVVGAALFIAALLLLVSWVLGSGVAAA